MQIPFALDQSSGPCSRVTSLICVVALALYGSPAWAMPELTPWTPLGPWGIPDPVAFAASPSQPQRLYIASELLPVQRSDDRGDSWRPAGRGFPLHAMCSNISVSPFDPDAVLAVVSGQIVRSDDGAMHWQPSSAGLPPSGTRCVFHDLGDPTITFAGGAQGIHRSTDGGRTWAPYGTGLEGVSGGIDEIVSTPLAPHLLLARGLFQLFRSSDAGSNWDEVFPEVTPYEDHGSEFAWSPSDPNVLYTVINGHGFQCSTDGGLTFTPRPYQELTTIYGIAVHPENPSTVFTADSNWWSNVSASIVVRRSTNGGATWDEMSSEPPCLNCGIWPRDLKIDPQNSDVMYLTKYDNVTSGRGKGLQRTDTGASGPWVAKTTGIAGIPVQKMSMTASSQMVARCAFRFGLQTTPLPFANWSTIPVSGETYMETGVLQAHSVASGKLLEAGVAHVSDTAYGVVRYRLSESSSWAWLLQTPFDFQVMAAQRHSSTDRIYFWTPGKLYRNGSIYFQFEQIPAPFFPTSAVIHPQSDDTIFASKSGTDPIQSSTDRGTTWASRSLGLPSGSALRVLVDPANGNHLAAIYTNGSPWESFDAGASWIERPAAFGSALVVAADWSPQSSNIFLATNVNGVHSTKWGPLNDGLPSIRLRDVLWSESRRELYVSSSVGGIHWRKVAPIGPGHVEAALVEPEGTSLSAPHPEASEDLAFSIVPNPFTRDVEISTSGGLRGGVEVTVFDAAGRRVRSSGTWGAAGSARRWIWNGRDEEGRAVAPGVYFVRIDSGGTHVEARVVRLR